MLKSREFTNYWQANILMAAADTAKDIKVAVSGKTLVILKLVVQVTVSAAQKVNIQDDSGTVIVFGLAASATGTHTWESTEGVELTLGEKFEIVPAAAGVEARVYAEGFVKG